MGYVCLQKCDNGFQSAPTGSSLIILSRLLQLVYPNTLKLIYIYLPFILCNYIIRIYNIYITYINK